MASRAEIDLAGINRILLVQVKVDRAIADTVTELTKAVVALHERVLELEDVADAR